MSEQQRTAEPPALRIAALPTILSLLAVAFLLCVAHWIYVRWRGEFGVDAPPWLEAYRSLFHLSEEGNLPTWFSTVLWLISSLLCWVAASGEGDRGRSWRWGLLALLFFYLGLDEGAQLHDRLGAVTDAWFSGFREGYSWVIPGAALVLLALAVFGPFVLRLPARVRWAFILGGALYVSGALGAELLEMYTLDDPSRMPALLNTDRLTVLEEGLEMVGLIVNILALLLYLRARPGVLLRIT